MRRSVARILPVVAGALAFVLVLSAFSVADGGPATAQPAPATMRIPVATPGDRALYTQEIIGFNGRAPTPSYNNVEHPPLPWMAFEMLDVALRPADDGEHRHYSARITQYDMAKLDGTPLRTYTVELDGGRPADPMPAGAAAPGDGADGGAAFSGLPPPAWDCMLWSLANGREADLTQPVVLYDGCDIWTAGSLDGGIGMQGSGGMDRSHAFQALGMDTVGGTPAVVLRHDWYGAYALVWMSEQVPYPLVVVMGEKPPPAGEGPQMVVYRLAQFEAGDGVPVLVDGAGAPLLAGVAAGLEHAVRTPWGLDESGTTMAFPASAAWAAAQETEAVRRWLGDHRAAATTQVEATHTLTTDLGRRTERHGWAFVADDGAGSLAFQVQRTVETLEAAPGVSVPLDDRVEVHSVQPGPSGFGDRQLPALLPTLASLEDAWRERVQPDAANATLDHWALWTTVKGDVALWNVAVGHDLQVQGTVVAQGRRDTSILRIEDSGASAHHGAPASEVPDEEPVPPFDTASADLDAAAIDEAAWRTPVAVAAAGGAGLAAAAVTAWLAWKPGVLGVALFSRIQEQRLLDHPVRRRIVDAVAAQPGIHGAELVRRVGAARGSVSHHLAKLVAAGQLVETQVGKYACYRLPTVKASTPPGSMHVLEALRGMPGASAAQLARTLGLAPATVHYHLQKLRAAGLLDPHAGPGLWPAGTRAASPA